MFKLGQLRVLICGFMELKILQKQLRPKKYIRVFPLFLKNKLNNFWMFDWYFITTEYIISKFNTNKRQSGLLSLNSFPVIWLKSMIIEKFDWFLFFQIWPVYEVYTQKFLKNPRKCFAKRNFKILVILFFRNLYIVLF